MVEGHGNHDLTPHLCEGLNILQMDVLSPNKTVQVIRFRPLQRIRMQDRYSFRFLCCIAWTDKILIKTVAPLHRRLGARFTSIAIDTVAVLIFRIRHVVSIELLWNCFICTATFSAIEFRTVRKLLVASEGGSCCPSWESLTLYIMLCYPHTLAVFAVDIKWYQCFPSPENQQCECIEEQDETRRIRSLLSAADVQDVDISRLEVSGWYENSAARSCQKMMKTTVRGFHFCHDCLCAN